MNSNILIPQSKNSKKGCEKKFSLSMQKCLICHIQLPHISKVINQITGIPTVLTKIISSYFVRGDQPVGNAFLHKRTRRMEHSTCIPCLEHITNNYLINSIYYHTNIQLIDCPHPRCTQRYYPTDIMPNLIE